MSPDPAVRVLVVQDDKTLLDSLCGGLRGRGHVAVAAETVADGLEQLRQGEFDVALLDLRLPDGSGADILERIAREELATEAVLLTGFATAEGALEAMSQGACDYLTKPPRMEELAIRVVKAAERSRLRRENAALRRRLEGQAEEEDIVAEDPAMKDLLATVARVAPSDLPVLIVGESGTGKGLLARALHRLGPRAARPFVAVDCGARPESRLESDLLGHETGAAGGVARRPGLFEVADGGVLFLDHVGDLPVPLQGRLLHALETGEVVRAEAARPARVDVRVVAATDRDLQAPMADDRFREDLYYRLNGVTLKVPPLRERRADVPLLARRFLERGGTRKTLTPRALEALQACAWPGNVPELRMVVRRAALLAPSDTVDAADLPLDLRDPGGRAGVRAGLSLAEMEREYIETVLRQHDGHRGKTARALGIDPKTLYNKLGPERPRKKAGPPGGP